MGHRVMPLNRTASLDVDRNTNRFARFRSTTFCERRAVNEDIATLLSVYYTQLTDFCPIMPRNVEQTPIADLSPHFGVTRRLIENDIDLIRFLAWQHRFNNRFRLEKIVSKKFCRSDLQIPLFNADRFFLLRSARTLALLLHQFFKSGNIDSQPALPRH